MSGYVSITGLKDSPFVTAFAQNFEKFFTYKHVAEIFLCIQKDVAKQEVWVQISEGCTPELLMQIPQQFSTTIKIIFLLTNGMLNIDLKAIILIAASPNRSYFYNSKQIGVEKT
jgi:hypothetical protein